MVSCLPRVLLLGLFDSTEQVGLCCLQPLLFISLESSPPDPHESKVGLENEGLSISNIINALDVGSDCLRIPLEVSDVVESDSLLENITVNFFSVEPLLNGVGLHGDYVCITTHPPIFHDDQVILSNFMFKSSLCVIFH